MAINRNAVRRAFTLIETLVSMTILTVGIATVVMSLGSLSKREATIREQEKMLRLAERKYDELVVTASDITNPQNGDFSEWQEPNYKWSSQSDTTGVDNLNAITITVEPVGGSSVTKKAVVTELLYVPPQTSATTATTATTGGN